MTRKRIRSALPDILAEVDQTAWGMCPCGCEAPYDHGDNAVRVLMVADDGVPFGASDPFYLLVSVTVCPLCYARMDCTVTLLANIPDYRTTLATYNEVTASVWAAKPVLAPDALSDPLWQAFRTRLLDIPTDPGSPCPNPFVGRDADVNERMDCRLSVLNDGRLLYTFIDPAVGGDDDAV